jgi:hypothetical protein
MEKKYKNNIIVFLIIGFILFIIYSFTLKILYCSTNKESYSNYIDYYNKTYNDPAYSHTVDLPLTTTYTCNNMCGSQSKCYLTGDQCTSDTDCPGCKIPIPSYKEYNSKNVKGNNNAGKYDYLVPQYSNLTNDIGTKAKLYTTTNKNAPPPPSYYGPILFAKSANIATKMNKNNSSFIWDPAPNDYNYLPKYPNRYSATGLFLDDGPLPSNSYLT